MYELDAYLDELVSLLDCDPLRRDEIRLEVHSHLRELLQEQTRKGKPPAEAARTAIAQFGTAEEVARRLTAANRGRVATRAAMPLGRRSVAVAVAFASSLVAMVGLNGLTMTLLRALRLEVAHPYGLVFTVTYVVTHLAYGALAAFVVWAVSRRPWDALLVCAVIETLVVLPERSGPWSWAAPPILAATTAVLIGAALAAYFLSKREKARGRGIAEISRAT